MNVGDLGEFGLIERLRALLGAPSDERLVAGIGEDAAAWRSGEGIALATTDTMVAGVHFLPGKVAWRDVGWKALAANISDIAAMGGEPSFALVTLCLPPATAVEDIDELYAGMQEISAVYGVMIVGGDVVSAPVFSITIALYGEALALPDAGPVLLRRDAAKAGDVVAVTAPLGGSGGGLRVLWGRSGGSASAAGAASQIEIPGAALLNGDAADRLVEMHMHPWPRVDAGDIALVAGIRCGIDISDGLAQDLGHICRASGVNAEVELPRVPVEEDLQGLFPEDAVRMAVTGGEDYELVLVGGEGAIERADAMLREHLEMEDTQQVIVIGRITGAGEGRVRLIDADGAEVQFEHGGWDHLRGAVRP